MRGSRFGLRSSRIWGLGIVLLLFLGVACGAAATATPAPTSAPQPTAVQPTAPTAVATATPAPAIKPAVVVNPGKLTIMVGHLANERFDIAFTSGGPGFGSYGRIVHEALISTNERTEMVPGIASQWGLSPDGLTWTFTIRKGVKWHDGSELTSEDVLWTLQHYFGPQASEYATYNIALTVSRRMDRIELTGPDNVSMTTKVPVTELANILSGASDKWIHMTPKRAALHDTEAEVAYDRKPIGAGFMRLAKHVPVSLMRFERFEDFYYQPKNGLPEDKRVNFQSLDLLIVPEEATRVAAIRTGEADIVPASLPTKKQVEAGGGRLVFGREGSYLEVALHGCWEPQYPCHDKRVRQALDYAINKEIIRDQLYGGPEVFQVKGWGYVTPSTIGYTPELDPWPFDPNKARQLLADAGYPGGKGFGKLIVNTHPSTAVPFVVEVAQLAAEAWKRELGLDVEVKVGDRTETSKRLNAGELRGQVHVRDNETARDYTNITSNGYGDPKYPRRLSEDPELLRLTQETVQILDADKRAEALKKLYLRLRDESYVLGIGYANIPWGVGPRVLTWEPYPMALHPSALHTITLK